MQRHPLGALFLMALVVIAKPAFSRGTGSRAEDLTGRPLVELFDPADRPAFERMLRAAMRGEHPEPAEARLRTERGDIRTVQWSSVLLRDAEGRIRHLHYGGRLTPRFEGGESLETLRAAAAESSEGE